MINYEGITLRYNGKIVLEDFYLKIDEGEKVLISGPSGCGKTTLLRLLLGFQTPDAGKIIFNGNKINSKNIKNVRKDIFYLSQDIDFRNGKVSEIIDEIFTFDANLELSYSDEYKDFFMKTLKLDKDLQMKEINDLSGGERQRLGLLIGFLLNRKVFLLDEPTSALDEEMKLQVADLFAENKKTVLVISHDDVFRKNDKYKRVDIE